MKKKSEKRVLSLLLVFAMLFSNVQTAFAAADTVNISAALTAPQAGAAAAVPSATADKEGVNVVAVTCEKLSDDGITWNEYADTTYTEGKYRFVFRLSGDIDADTKTFINGSSASSEMKESYLLVYTGTYTVHVHSFTNMITESRYCIREATCSEKALYYYSCACGTAGTETFETEINPDNHAGAKHTWSSSVDKRDEQYHWFVCKDCGREMIENKTAHTWDSGTVTKEATVFAKGEKQYKCSGCGLVKKEEIPAITDVNYCSAYSRYNGSMYANIRALSSSSTPVVTDEAGNVLRKNRDYTLSYQEIEISKRYLSKVYGSRQICVENSDKYYVFTVKGTRTSATAVVIGEYSYLEAGDYATSAVDSEKYSLVQGRDFTIETGKFVFKNAYLDTFGGNRTVTIVVDGFTYTETVKGKKILKNVNDLTIYQSFINVIYSGTVKVPKIVMPRGMVKGKDYTIEYSNEKSSAMGQYYIRITGKGDYTGTRDIYYYITSKPTFIRSIDAAKNSAKIRWKLRSASADGYVIEYSKYSSMSSSKKIYVNSSSTTLRKITGLKKNQRYYIRMCSYRYVQGSRICSDWTVIRTFKTAR